MLPFRFYRGGICEAHVLALFRESRIDTRIQTVGPDDGPLWHVVLYEHHDQISHLTPGESLIGNFVAPILQPSGLKITRRRLYFSKGNSGLSSLKYFATSLPNVAASSHKPIVTKDLKLPNDSESKCHVIYGKDAIGNVSLTNSAMSPVRSLILFFFFQCSRNAFLLAPSGLIRQ